MRGSCDRRENRFVQFSNEEGLATTGIQKEKFCYNFHFIHVSATIALLHREDWKEYAPYQDAPLKVSEYSPSLMVPCFCFRPRLPQDLNITRRPLDFNLNLPFPSARTRSGVLAINSGAWGLSGIIMVRNSSGLRIFLSRNKGRTNRSGLPSISTLISFSSLMKTRSFCLVSALSFTNSSGVIIFPVQWSPFQRYLQFLHAKR